MSSVRTEPSPWRCFWTTCLTLAINSVFCSDSLRSRERSINRSARGLSPSIDPRCGGLNKVPKKLPIDCCIPSNRASSGIILKTAAVLATRSVSAKLSALVSFSGSAPGSWDGTSIARSSFSKARTRSKYSSVIGIGAGIITSQTPAPPNSVSTARYAWAIGELLWKFFKKSVSTFKRLEPRDPRSRSKAAAAITKNRWRVTVPRIWPKANWMPASPGTVPSA